MTIQVSNQHATRGRRFAIAVCSGVLFACLFRAGSAWPAEQIRPGNLVMHLQERFGLSEPQVRGALGALLVFAQDKLAKSDFDDLSRRVPNAQRNMSDVKQQGIVTGPLDDVDEYERTLSNLEIGQPLASQFAPAVLEYLSAAGYDRESGILAGVLD
jgi:uncharacterized protein VcgC/VcgE DUF2780